MFYTEIVLFTTATFTKVDGSFSTFGDNNSDFLTMFGKNKVEKQIIIQLYL